MDTDSTSWLNDEIDLKRLYATTRTVTTAPS